MDIERALVSKIVSTGQLEEAISRGVREDLFVDEECRDLFTYVKDHAKRYKSTPSLPAVKQDRPKFEWIHVQDSLDYLVDKFTILCKRRLANEMVLELAEACNDPKRAERIDSEFLEVSRKLATLVPSQEVERFSQMDKRILEYEQQKKKGTPVGVPFGFPKLDEWTSGIQPHEFVTVSGFSGTGKSTMLQAIAFNVWASGYTPLYISLEMEARTLLRRFDAMATNLSYNKLKQLKLSDEQIEDWKNTSKEIQKKTADIPIIDNIRHCTPDNIYAETIRYAPDIVIIDYLSLMRTSSPTRGGTSIWQSLTEITQDLKQNARTLKTPILAAAQTNRAGKDEGAELDNIGYSLSVVQDSDIVLGLYSDEEMRERKEMEIRLNKNRDGRIDKFRAIWDHDSMNFEQKAMFERQEE